MSDSYKIYASKDYVDSKALPEGATAHQQLVTDGEGVAKWEDRTHYTSITLTPVWEPGEVDVSVVSEYMPGWYEYPRNIDDPLDLIEETLYRVQIDDDKFDVVATFEPAMGLIVWVHSDNWTEEIPEGEKAFAISAVGEVFLHGYDPGIHTVSIQKPDTEIKQIPKEYIPQMVGKSDEYGTGEIFNDYDSNIASGEYSHAEGYMTKATGAYSHAEGDYVEAKGDHSHAEGYANIAYGDYQHVQGRGARYDTKNQYAHIVGNGTKYNDSNAHTLDWDGNAWFAGTIKVGGNGQNHSDAQEVALKSEVPTDAHINELISTALAAFTNGEEVSY